MKLLKKIKIENASLLVLFFGMISTLGGAVWAMLLRYTIRTQGIIGASSYYDGCLSEIAFCAFLHIAVGVILYIDERKRLNN